MKNQIIGIFLENDIYVFPIVHSVILLVSVQFCSGLKGIALLPIAGGC